MSEKISISAALRRAARIRGQIKEHGERAQAAACYIEGKEPAFPFAASIESRQKLVGDLLKIETAVAEANARAGKLSSGVTVLYAIRKLAELKSEIAFYRGLPVRAKEKDTDVEETTDYDLTLEKHVRREKKTVHVSAITQAKRAEKVDALQAEFDRLNSELESHNHRTEIEF